MHDAALIPVPVVGAAVVATRQVLLTLDVAAAAGYVDAYSTPGQYAKLAFEDGVARPFALASPPAPKGDAAHMQFLLKVPAERVAALESLGAGDKVAMGRPQGRGFPLDKLSADRSLWLFGVGSGVAPLRAVVEHLLARREGVGEISLFYGVRHVDELAFRDRFGAWAGLGVRVVPVVSQPEAGSWDGKTGHVQDHLPKVIERPDRAVVFVCGRPEMDRDVAAALLERGVGPEQIFRNY